mgnify:CR=1 FL=1
MKQSIAVVDRMLFVLFVDWFAEYDYEVHAPAAEMKALGARVRLNSGSSYPQEVA